MGLAPGPSCAEESERGARRPGDGEGDKADEQIELARVGESGVLEVEAAGLGVAKETFDGPAPAVGGERLPGGAVGGDDDPLAGLEPLGGEAEAVAAALSAGAEPAAEDLGAPAPVQAGVEGEFMALPGGDAQVAAQADGEGDVVFTEKIGLVAADELPVGEQEPDGGEIEEPEVAAHQRDPLAAA